MKYNQAEFRCYEELNDFLPPSRQKTAFIYHFRSNPGIKDVIEGLGIPHTEIDLILVNGKSKSFHYQLKNGDHVSVYPIFERVDVSSVTRVALKPLRNPKFILDVHLGKLARYLRLLGFDAYYQNDYTDAEIVKIVKATRRIILTRDIGLLKHSAIKRGHWLRATQPKLQIKEVLHCFKLVQKVKPFTRCLECNGKIIRINKKDIVKKLPLKTNAYYHDFYRCRDCKRVYWEGSHYQKLNELVKELQV